MPPKTKLGPGGVPTGVTAIPAKKTATISVKAAKYKRLVPKRRKTNRSRNLYLTVNKDDVVELNGVIIE